MEGGCLEDGLSAVTSKILNDLLKGDPLLSDLPRNVTLEEVNAQIALHQGQSITVYVDREQEGPLPVVVHQRGSTVSDLKRAFRRHVVLKLVREQNDLKVSWRYVWKNNWLSFDGRKLKDDPVTLEDLGIRNRSHVKFVGRLGEKGVKE